MKKRQKIKTMARNERVTAIHSPMVSRQMRLFSQREARARVATLYLRLSSAAQSSDFAPLSSNTEGDIDDLLQQKSNSRAKCASAHANLSAQIVSYHRHLSRLIRRFSR